MTRQDRKHKRQNIKDRLVNLSRAYDVLGHKKILRLIEKCQAKLKK